MTGGTDNVPSIETPTSPYSVFSVWQKRYIIGLVALAGWFSTLSSFIYYPAISLIATDLHTSIARINLTVTSYMIVSAVAPAITGDAADIYGRRPLYLATLSMYVIANTCIAIQSSFVGLLLLRMLQSAGISGQCLLREIRTNGAYLASQEHFRSHMALLLTLRRLRKEVLMSQPCLLGKHEHQH